MKILSSMLALVRLRFLTPSGAALSRRRFRKSSWTSGAAVARQWVQSRKTAEEAVWTRYLPSPHSADYLPTSPRLSRAIGALTLHDLFAKWERRQTCGQQIFEPRIETASWQSPVSQDSSKLEGWRRCRGI